MDCSASSSATHTSSPTTATSAWTRFRWRLRWPEGARALANVSITLEPQTLDAYAFVCPRSRAVVIRIARGVSMNEMKPPRKFLPWEELRHRLDEGPLFNTMRGTPYYRDAI